MEIRNSLRLIGQFAFAGAVIATFSSCSSLKPVQDETVYYRLSAQILESKSGGALSDVSPNSIVDLDFPEDVHINKLMIVEGDNTVKLLNNARWIEPFDKAFERSLDLNLRASLGRVGLGVDLSVEILSFTITSSEVICKYAYRDSAYRDSANRVVLDGESVVSGVSEARETYANDVSLDALVAAIDAVTAQMAEQLASALRSKE